MEEEEGRLHTGCTMEQGNSGDSGGLEWCSDREWLKEVELHSCYMCEVDCQGDVSCFSDGYGGEIG